MGSKKLKIKTDKKNTINNSKDNLIPKNLTNYGDNMSMNSVKTKAFMRCHICCKNFSTEEYCDHKKKYHNVPSKNTDSSTKKTDFSTKNTDSSTKNTDSSTKNTDFSTKINQRIDNNNIEKPGIATKVDKRVPSEGGYDDWKCSLCPSLIVNSSALLEHVKSYDHSTTSRPPVRQFSPNYNTPVVLLKRNNSAGVGGKRWARSITEHIKAVLDFKLKVRRFDCEFCKKSCMDPDHFEIHQWSRSTLTLKSFECTRCPKSFETQTQLEMHTSLHI